MAMKNKCDDVDQTTNGSTREKKYRGELVRRMKCIMDAKLVDDVDLDGVWQLSATMFCSDNGIRLVTARRPDSSYGFCNDNLVHNYNF